MFLELDGRGPRYAQITRALLAAVTAGALRPGARLPPTRALAKQLGCSRNIVLLAYEQLILEGYLQARARAGTFVSTDLPKAPGGAEPRPASPRRRRPALSAAGRRLAQDADRARAVTRRPRRWPIDFMYGQCEPDPRVVGHLRRGFGRGARRTVRVRLRRSRRRRRPARRDRAAPARIARRGADGRRRSSSPTARSRRSTSARGCCSSPAIARWSRIPATRPRAPSSAPRAPPWFRSRSTAKASIHRRSRIAGGARLLYVTPSHQFPTGAILTAARRHRSRLGAPARRLHPRGRLRRRAALSRPRDQGAGRRRADRQRHLLRHVRQVAVSLAAARLPRAAALAGRRGGQRQVAARSRRVTAPAAPDPQSHAKRRIRSPPPPHAAPLRLAPQRPRPGIEDSSRARGRDRRRRGGDASYRLVPRLAPPPSMRSPPPAARGVGVYRSPPRRAAAEARGPDPRLRPARRGRDRGGHSRLGRAYRVCDRKRRCAVNRGRRR